MKGGYYTKQYENLLETYGYSREAVNQKIEQVFQTMFYGPEEERLYHPVGDDMGYIEDSGNHDVRTEGMSYGMMVSVQLDKKEEFDRIWKWVKTYMYMGEGWNAGYFAWSCHTDGSRNSEGPAPDGEEYFAMALFFASHRWGDGEGIFCYSEQAKAILKACIHNGENQDGEPMWDPENKLIKFITCCDFSDPSYHLPHFYELFALWANEEDRPFWKEAAQASRKYLKIACHPVTGLCAEYAHYDGTPVEGEEINGERHDWYFSDSYRTVANVALDYQWFGADEWAVEECTKLQHFFCHTVADVPEGIYEIDGTVIEKEARHPIAIIATNAQASLAAQGEDAQACVEKFWNTDIRKGPRRYYDNFLYLYALLALSGNYRIW